MYILPQERPQNVGYTDGVLDLSDSIMYNVKGCKFCIKCKYSVPNVLYSKDEFDCYKTKGICNALYTCNCFEENC